MLKSAKVAPSCDQSCFTSCDTAPSEKVFPVTSNDDKVGSPHFHPTASNSVSVTFEEPQRDSAASFGSGRSVETLGDGDEDDEGSRRRRKPRGMFADPDELKNKVLQNMIKKPKEDYYLTTGLFQLIARSTSFEQCTLLVIGVNAIWIAIDTDNNTADVLLNAQARFQVVEHIFCFYFSIELYIRFMAFRKARHCIRDPWMLFDSVLVTLMVLETWITTAALLLIGSSSAGGVRQASVLRVARLLRLVRMGRMVRLLRAMPELMILIKGMASAARSVLFTLCLLMIAIYVYAIAFVQLTRDSVSGRNYFPNVPKGMYTLIVYGTLLDEINSIMEALLDDSFVCALIYLSFVFISSLTVMNMLIGILCEVVQTVASTEKEQLLMGFVKSRIEELFQSRKWDVKKITRQDFDNMLQSTAATNALQDVGVDPVALVDFADVIFDPDNDGVDDHHHISFENLMELVLELRGSNIARVKDIVEMRKVFRGESKRQQERLERLEEKLFKGARSCSKELSRASSRSFSNRTSSKMQAQGIGQEGRLANDWRYSLLLPLRSEDEMPESLSIPTEEAVVTRSAGSPRSPRVGASTRDWGNVDQLSQLSARMERLEGLLQQEACCRMKQEAEFERVGKQLRQVECLLNQMVSRFPPTGASLGSPRPLP